MFRFGLQVVVISFLMVVCVLCASCNKDKDAKAVVSAGSRIAEVGEDHDVVAPRRLPPPPGDPGPFLVRMESGLPNHIFGAASTSSHFAIAMQSDARDISLCPETNLQVCFRGLALFSERSNPNRPVIIKLYESDTQSGSQVDDIAAVGERFVFALNEGIYVGDVPKTTLMIVDMLGNVERVVDIGVPRSHVSQVSMSAVKDNELIVCRSIQPDVQRDQLMERIICESYNVRNSQRSVVASIQSDIAIRAIDVSSNGSQTLLTWNEGGRAKAALLERITDVLDFGPATTMQPYVSAGLDAFAVAWQGDDGFWRVDGISVDGRRIATIMLNGVSDCSIDGLVAVSHGYLLSFRYRNTQQTALIADDFKSWHLVENSDHWRMFSGYASLDIQDAHTGRIIWQTAESLVSAK